jgi:translation elongation factor EF-1beta
MGKFPVRIICTAFTDCSAEADNKEQCHPLATRVLFLRIDLKDYDLPRLFMDERTSFQRILQDTVLRWTTVATGFVLYCVVVSLIAIRYAVAAEYLAPIGFGLVAIHFIFTVSNEVQRKRQARTSEKTKRQYLEMDDDGELVEFEEQEQMRSRQ